MHDQYHVPAPAITTTTDPMKLQQLESLLAVVEHGSIRAAARHLNVSQAAVTKSMRLLEEEAGVPLLLRRSRGIELTDAGRRLTARARVITHQVSLAQEDMRQTAGDDRGSLRVGMTPFVTRTALGAAFGWFRQRYKNVRLELADGLVHRVLPRIRDGSLDMAITTGDVDERLDDAFQVEQIQRMRQCIAVRRGHPVLENPSAQALLAHEWVVTRPIAGDKQAEMFATAGLPVPPRVIVCEGLQALVLLRHSDGVTIMLEQLLSLPDMHDITTVRHTTLQPSDLALMLVTRSDVPLTRAGEYFAHCIRQTLRSAQAA